MTTLPGREGLQPERTALAWQRSAITATMVMVPLIVVSVRLGLWPMTVLECAATASAVVLVVAVRRRFAQLRDQDIPVSPFIPMAGVAAVTVLAAVVGLVTAVVVFGS
jgi:negative regulator of sigma E activity